MDKKVLVMCVLFLSFALVISCETTESIWTKTKDTDTLKLDIDTGRLYCPQTGIGFADKPYHYSISGAIDGGKVFEDARLTEKNCKEAASETIVTGRFENTNINLSQIFRHNNGRLQETITLKNTNSQPVTINKIELGFVADTTNRPDWRLCAIPFRVQLDGSVHDYSTEQLNNGKFHNAVYTDKTRPEPPLTEEGCLRSEAWAWWNGCYGLTIIKYNNEAIELSVACPQKQGDEMSLRFGGAGVCLYGEPSTARRLAPGEQITLGTTYYVPFEGSLNKGFICYRDLLDSKGHTFPADYNPPVNWNELYDIGWYHSNTEKLKKYYTREAILREAQKAKDCGCELLYLDPGWEIAEGTTLWDESRLGTVEDMIKTLKEDYGLKLGYRTILRCYINDHWPSEFMVKPLAEKKRPIAMCLCNPKFRKEKLKRILDISKHGVSFMMFDEMDWRGPCYDGTHEHRVPTTPLDHVLAVYGLCKEVRNQCPSLIVEAHDPVWPWHTCIYAPTYFKQGFGDKGYYDENWGFEYMWNCLNDLKSGKAMALYYYNLGCNIPLYLHITMAADNDNCVFFWWAASTVRHLGIGGKRGLGSKPKHDPEKRFADYQEQMKIYKRLKPYFVRGRFDGLAENIHLHTLPDKKGGVIAAFNLTNDDKELKFLVPKDLLGSNKHMPVEGAKAKWKAKVVKLELKMPAMSPAVICIGDATKK